MGSTRPAGNPGDLTLARHACNCFCNLRVFLVEIVNSFFVCFWILVLKHIDVSGFVQSRTALYSNVLTCPKTYWFVMKQKVLTCTETYRSMLTCTERDWVVPKHTETSDLYWIKLNCTDSHTLNILNCTCTELYRKPQPQHHDKTPIAKKGPPKKHQKTQKGQNNNTKHVHKNHKHVPKNIAGSLRARCGSAFEPKKQRQCVVFVFVVTVTVAAKSQVGLLWSSSNSSQSKKMDHSSFWLKESPTKMISEFFKKTNQTKHTKWDS